MPSLPRKIMTFSKAAYKHVLGGLKHVSDDIMNERAKQCQSCEFRTNNICNHENCGCRLDVKLTWASEACPIGKWLDIKE